MKFLILLAMTLGACKSTLPTPQQEIGVADYAAEQQACIDNAKTLQESQTCRAAVKAKYGR